MDIIKTYKDYIIGESKYRRIRNCSRNAIVNLYSLSKSISRKSSCIQFPYYHHVFDDEIKDFERQLKYLKNYGDFITLDQSIDMIAGKVPLFGRYFCVSFDDGYRCCYSNMVEVTSRLNIPVIIYLPTDFISLDENNEDDVKKLKDNMPDCPKIITYLNWNQCREMLRHQVSFGSHTKTHANLSKISFDQIKFELFESKKKIESELLVMCRHFACPWGKIHQDFDPATVIPIAKEVGFESIVTTNRGKNIRGDNAYLLKRDHFLAGWGNAQLKYFLGE